MKYKNPAIPSAGTIGITNKPYTSEYALASGFAREEGLALDKEHNRINYVANDVISSETRNLSYSINSMNQYTTVISDSSLVTPSYDLNHNLTNDGKFVYSWNSENQLTAVRKASDNSLVAEYFYDPIGRRI